VNCEQASGLVALAASSDVTPEERRALESHAAGCAECRAEASAFEALCGQLAAMREEAAPGHAYAAVRARVVAEVNLRRRQGRVAAWAGFAAVVACSLILVVALHHEAPITAQPPVPVRAAVADVPDEVPAIVAPSANRRIRKVAMGVETQESGEPLVVHMLTSDPDVVIYWIADAKGKRSSKGVIQ
jgi:hypothetical protein